MKCAFVGRKEELAALAELTEKKAASLVVLTGRRRIGKSRLIEEFADRHGTYKRAFISALAPQEGITPALQRRSFAEQLQLELGLPPVQHASWMDLLVHLARATERGRWIILLDEVSWMAGNDPEFLPKLKIVWDRHLKRNPRLIMVLCGSVSSWLERNILSSTGFVGRVSLDLRLDELPLPHCEAFWGKARTRTSARDKLMMLSVTGGVPRYLEEIIASRSVEENIRRLCFSPGALLLREFDQIFSDLFDRRGPIHRRIVTALAEGHGTMQQITTALGKEKGGVMSRYLEELCLSGFIRREHPWDLHRRRASKLSRFRLKDNYLRFYLRCILPHREEIQDRRLAGAPLRLLPGWDGVMGLQFENLVLQNRRYIWERCGLTAHEIALEGPFFQQRTRRRRGCQIDYMIQTRQGPVYVCEIKFSRDRITAAVEERLRAQIEHLALPRHCSVLPVLIHASDEVSEQVTHGGFFARVIDFTEIFG